jgi:hypothetical protein
VSRSENTWNPPESVSTGPPHPEKAWIPPRRSTTSSPGRKWRWYVLPRITCAPSARTSSGWSDFTVAFVPTGMNAGVGIGPWAVWRTPARASPSVAESAKLIAWADFRKLRELRGATPRLHPLSA